MDLFFPVTALSTPVWNLLYHLTSVADQLTLLLLFSCSVRSDSLQPLLSPIFSTSLYCCPSAVPLHTVSELDPPKKNSSGGRKECLSVPTFFTQTLTTAMRTNSGQPARTQNQAESTLFVRPSQTSQLPANTQLDCIELAKKSSLGFSMRCYGKTQWNILANLVHTKVRPVDINLAYHRSAEWSSQLVDF